MSTQVFRCGHERERTNMTFLGGQPTCRTCHNERQRLRKRRVRAAQRAAAFLASAQAKPHLYPAP